ncbi:Nif11-like leader peptide family natural product precursor [Sporomusa malonica]|uniref:Nif11-like leader peptide domain-containing protein n=1 Tax=Sporomusa malonica TaxID=112901 RepID=A0A1W1YAJ5_9FIRM|nr:Nif11-like leader peptide family natural product precursor [Sporomusa malonica]SMC33230.1 nif11-like leader peptide domain-containing protein [Sporomusa malonica]
MSIESAKAFAETMKTDQEFANKINKFKNLEEAKEFIKEAGFDFTLEEFNELSKELMDNELESVTGGAHGDNCGWNPMYHH